MAAALLASTPALATYSLIKEYSGTDFFTGWDFYGNYDNLTSGMRFRSFVEVLTAHTPLGDVIWVDQANATTSKLVYVNDAGNAIIKVDNTTNVPYNEKRDTVCFAICCCFPALYERCTYTCARAGTDHQ